MRRMTNADIMNEADEAGKIFVGTVTVCGTIGMDDFFAPARIAETFWSMYKERNACEVVYEYPALRGTEHEASTYWAKVYGLKGTQI